jgi:hypothetical protein
LFDRGRAFSNVHHSGPQAGGQERKTTMKRLALILFAVLPCLALPCAAGTPLAGTFALQNGAAKTSAYLIAAQLGSNLLDRRLDTWMTRSGSPDAIRTYRVDMTKYLHMIVISDDFRVFLHVHPVLGRDGHFILDQKFPSPDLYHVYVDATPESIGQQVFRFDFTCGSPGREGRRDLSERRTTSPAGPYEVTISSDTLPAGSEARLVIHITRKGKPATDLHPYLGALAHAVFIDAKNLSYVHAHPMPLSAAGAKTPDSAMTEMPSLPASAISSPDMMLHAALKEAGTYKLWLQFRGGDRLYVAPFVIAAT